MKITLSDKNLTEYEKEEIEILLSRKNTTISSDLEQMWYLMDLKWDDYLCDNVNLNWENIGGFYGHPVWLLNGLFQEQDKESMSHRHGIADWINKKEFINIVDYGGGFGTLARLIAKNNMVRMNIYEPHPSEFGIKRANEYKNITMIDKLSEGYDCLISTDVLEHVPDPLHDLSEMIQSVKLEGYLIIANAFFPMIKCHLPQDFHFRYSFDFFAKMMGLEKVGIIKGSHAIIYKKNKVKNNNWFIIRNMEKISKLIFNFIEVSKFFLRPIKRLFT